jgi:hypothetical protein
MLKHEKLSRIVLILMLSIPGCSQICLAQTGSTQSGSGEAKPLATDQKNKEKKKDNPERKKGDALSPNRFSTRKVGPARSEDSNKSGNSSAGQSSTAKKTTGSTSSSKKEKSNASKPAEGTKPKKPKSGDKALPPQKP